jgi:hypothetical protein
MGYNRPMTPEPMPIPEPPPIPEDMSEFNRISGTFFSPMAAFADIARRPRWWIPMIIIGLVGTAGIIAFSQHVGWDSVVRKAIDQGPNAQNMTPAQRQQAMAVAARFLPLLAYVAPIGVAITIVLLSAVLILVTNVLMGAKISFSSMLGVVGYGGIPPALVTTALTTLVMFLKSPEDFDINNPLAFNAGAFLPGASAKWIMSLAGSLDLFSFWRIGLLAAGITAASPKIKFGKALFAVAFLWALYVAIKTGWTAAFG